MLPGGIGAIGVYLTKPNGLVRSLQRNCLGKTECPRLLKETVLCSRTIGQRPPALRRFRASEAMDRDSRADLVPQISSGLCYRHPSVHHQLLESLQARHSATSEGA